jgi:hypothetical protein
VDVPLGVSELDRVKEQLVYLRFWLGILVVTEITLIGWLVSTPTEPNRTLWFTGFFVAILFGVGAILVHRQIERRIGEVGKL